MKKILISLLLTFVITPIWAQDIESLTKAANQGDANAQNKLGECYYLGQGVKKDYKKAFYLFEKAASKGITEAQYYIGECYYKGRGVKKNYYKADDWLSIAWSNRSDLTDKEQEATEAMLASTKKKLETKSIIETIFDDNLIYGVRFDYFKRSLDATKIGADNSNHFNIFRKSEWSNGFSLGLNMIFRFGDNSHWGLRTGAFINFDHMKNKYADYSSNDNFHDIGFSVPLQLAYLIPWGDNNAIINLGLIYNCSLKAFYTNSHYPYTQTTPLSYGEQGGINRSNFSLAFGLSIPLGNSFLLDVEYQNGFTNEPLWEDYNSKFDKFTLGLTFLLGDQ